MSIYEETLKSSGYIKTSLNMVNLPIKAKKRKNPVIKQITTTTLIKPAISVIISFLILALIYSSFPNFNVAFAYYCQNNGVSSVKCCTGVTLKGPIYRYTWCTICDKTDPPQPHSTF